MARSPVRGTEETPPGASRRAGERRRRWSLGADVPLSGPVIVAYIVVGLLGAEVAVGYGVYQMDRVWSTTGGGSSGLPPGQNLTFELKAFLTGFVGVGGSIDGVRNPTLAVGLGDHVAITVVDGEAQVHNFHLDGYGLDTPNLAGIGQNATVTFVATQEGEFAYYCTIPGHRAMGMAGTLVVGEAKGPTIPPEGPLGTSFISRDPTDLPPLITRNYSTTVNIYLQAKEITAEIEPGTSYTYWTYNGTVPGPFFRVRVNDTVIVHFSNDANSSMNHSVDFHAVTGPLGGAAVTQTAPGSTSSFSFRAMVPGLFVYHCGTPNIPTHIAMGMYGLFLVQPDSGMVPVTHEFYLVEGEFYTQWAIHTPGHQLFNGTALLDEQPTYVVFNGRYDAFTGVHALHAQVNDTVRIFFGDAGPNVVAAFHMIGNMFDLTYAGGDLLDPPLHGLQTVLVAPGSSTVEELTLMYPANYPLVDHAIVNAIDKGAFAVLNVTGWADSSIFQKLGPASALPATVAASGSAVAPFARRGA